MSSIEEGVSKEEVVFAARMGKEHESSVSFKNTSADIRDVTPETIVRSVRKAVFFRVSLRAASSNPEGDLIWNIVTHSRPNVEVCPIYEFTAPNLAAVRALMLAKTEKEELSAVARKGKQERRKSIDD